jgi:hypothetical protein
LSKRRCNDPLDVARFTHIGFDDNHRNLVIVHLANLIAHFTELICVSRNDRQCRSALAREAQRQSRPSPCDAPVIKMFLPASRFMIQH